MALLKCEVCNASNEEALALSVCLRCAKPLKWTRERPTTPGAYWVRRREETVVAAHVGAVVMKQGNLRLTSSFWRDVFVDYDFGIEWAGPIREPEEW